MLVAAATAPLVTAIGIVAVQTSPAAAVTAPTPVDAWYMYGTSTTALESNAASDMEPSWDGAGITKKLVDGANAANFHRYYDFGSADGCPTSGTGGRCNNGWWVSPVAYVSQHGVAAPLPEIYPPLTTLAAQWTVVRKNWDANHSSSYRTSRQ